MITKFQRSIGLSGSEAAQVGPSLNALIGYSSKHSRLSQQRVVSPFQGHFYCLSDASYCWESVIRMRMLFGSG